MITMEAFNGHAGFERHYNGQQDMHEAEWKWPVMKTQPELAYDKVLYANFLQPLCVEHLRKYLAKMKDRVMGKGKAQPECLNCQVNHISSLSSRKLVSPLFLFSIFIPLYSL